MDRPKCDECGKSLEHKAKALHPGVGVASAYLKAPRRNAQHLDVLLDSLEESGHAGLRGYLNYARTHGQHRHVVAAVRDIRNSLRRPDAAPRLAWRSEDEPGQTTYHAETGHGRYELGGPGEGVTYTPHGGGEAVRVARMDRFGGLSVVRRAWQRADEHHRRMIHEHFAEEERQ